MLHYGEQFDPHWDVSSCNRYESKLVLINCFLLVMVNKKVLQEIVNGKYEFNILKLLFLQYKWVPSSMKINFLRPFSNIVKHIDWLLDINAMSTLLVLFYAQRLGNCTHCTFLFTYFVYYRKSFFRKGYIISSVPI